MKPRETTKLRVVYHCNAKKRNHPSLNDCVHSGPCLLPKIVDLLIRFRCFKFGLTSDIKAAFLRIKIAHKDRDYFRLLWFKDVNTADPEIVVLRFSTVIFGLNAAPFLLGATINSHLQQFADVNEDFVQQFLRDLYMDDSVTGFHTEENAFSFYVFVKSMMLEGNFVLLKWNSNSTKLINEIREYEKKLFGNDENERSRYCKVLGIKWVK